MTFVLSNTDNFVNQINAFIMIPFFVYLLIELGLLLYPEQWNTLPPEEQERLEQIIIVDDTPHQP